jgi:hypothetical protein
MKKLIAALALAALAATPALAETMENSFGNTIVVTTASGANVRYHFNADGSYTQIAPDGTNLNGAWTQTGDQLCMTPQGSAQPACVTVEQGKNVGDTWQQAGADGSQITVMLQAGR